MARAMLEVMVGNLMESALYPMRAPMKVSGMEMQHHMAATMRTSKKGADAEECMNAKMMLKKMNIPKADPGKSVAVKTVQNCQYFPLKAL